MNKFFSKINWQYFISIILAFLASLYTSYLIIRISDYNFLSIFIICLFLLILFESLTFFIKKNFNFQAFPKFKKIWIIISAILLTSIIFIFNIKFFSYTFKDTELTINSNGNGQIIERIVIDNVFYNNREDKIFHNDYNGHQIINIISDDLNNSVYKLNFKKASRIQLVFKNEINNVSITDGSDLVNLSKTTVYNVQSNAIFDSISIIRGILSYILIFTIIFSVISILLDNTKKKCFIFTIIVTLLIGICYFTNSRINIMFGDSWSYIDFNFSKFSHFIFSGRTPVYPMIIRICRKISLNHFLSYVCFIQYFFWFFSILYLYKLLNLFIKNELICTIFSLLYAISPTIVGWNNDILTESLALSGTLIFTYYIINYLKNDNLKSAIIAVILGFILTFHRPTSLLLVAFLEIFLILRFIFDSDKRKNDFKCFVGNTISIILIVGYAIIFHHTYGIYSLSDALVRQDLYINMQEGYYKSSDNQEFIEKVEIAIQENPDSLWNAMCAILDQYKLSELKKINQYCRLENLDEYVNYIIGLTKSQANVRMESYLLTPNTPLNEWLYMAIVNTFDLFTFGHIYILFFIEFLLTIFLWVKNKKIPWINLGLFAFPCAIVFSSFIGTSGEFMRTAICCVPFAYISLCLLIDSVYRKEKNA